MIIFKQETKLTAKAGLAAIAAVMALVSTSAAQAADVGMTVTKDPVTGELRAPTAEEHAALQKAKAKASALTQKKLANGKSAPVAGKLAEATNPETVLQDGTVQLQLDEESLVYSVVKRNADGTMSMECVTGNKAANKYVKAKSPTSSKIAHSDKEHGYALK